MTRSEHIEKAEQLLESAKDLARLKPESDVDKKANQSTMVDLLDFARVHAAIAAATTNWSKP